MSLKYLARTLRKFLPCKPKAHAQYGNLVLVVVLVLQSEGHYHGDNVSHVDSFNSIFWILLPDQCSTTISLQTKPCFNLYKN